LLSLFSGRKSRALPVSLQVTSEAEKVPTQGLIRVNYGLHSEAPCEATLEVTVGGARQPAWRKAIALAAGQPQDTWLALHGHLLPNGPAKISVRLLDGRTVLAERNLTVQVRNEGETARRVAASLRASGVPLAIDGEIDSSLYDYADPSLTAWFDRGPEAVEAHLAGLAARGEANAEEIAALRHFAEEGYLVLPGRIDAEHIGRLNAALDDAVARKVEGYEWGASQRLHDLHLSYPAIHELWLHPKILQMLGLVFGEAAKPSQSLTYVFGSEQQHHQDVVHLTPFPQGLMCGVWTALEDVQPESGELLLYPRSHKLNRVYMASVGARKVGEDWTEFVEIVAGRWGEMIEASDLGQKVYRPKAGEVLIWHENLMHGGMVRQDKTKSRRSIVGHYFANGSIVYADSFGLPGRVYEAGTA
jgi:hypothetical protein